MDDENSAPKVTAQELLNDRTIEVDDEEKFQIILESGFVKTPKGRTYLASLLMKPTFVFMERLHTFLKNHIFTMEKNKAENIGKIYRTAWKKSDHDHRKKLETVCIQDLIRCALWTKQQVASYCLEVLQPFFTKDLKEMDSIMYILAEPLIWRSLESVNREIRYNAIALFLRMFPMRDVSLEPCEQKELLDRQFKILKDFMFDVVPAIRILTIEGVCRIINFYWEIFTPSDLKKLLLALFVDLVRDVSNAGVRLAVYKGISDIAKNPLSHLTLESMLPKLSMGIHDRSEAVRSAVVDLMLQIRSVKTLKFWNVVPVEHIVHQLASETSASISKHICELLFPTYFPLHESPHIRLQRALILFKTNLTAARKFYRHASGFTTVETSVEQILLLLRCVYGCIREAQSANKSLNVSGFPDNGGNQSKGGNAVENANNTNVENANQENTNDDQENVSTVQISDKPIILGLLDCAAILWNSIGLDLDKSENADAKKVLQKTGGKIIMVCMNFFDDSAVMDSVLVLVGLLSKFAAAYLSGSLLKQFHAIEEGGFDRRTHGSLIETLCYLQLKEIVKVIGKWWRNYDSAALTADSSSSPPSRAKRVRISAPESPDIAKPKLALQIVSFLLDRSGTRKYIMQSHIDQLRQLEKELQGPWEQCLSVINNPVFDSKWTRELLNLRATMACLIYSKEGGVEEATKFLACYFDLIRNNVIPVLNAGDTENAENDDSAQEIAEAIIKASLGIMCNFIMCGLCDDKVIILSSDFSKIILNHEASVSFRVEQAQLTYHILDYIRNQGIKTDVAQLLRPWFELIDQFSNVNKDQLAGMSEITDLIEKFSTLMKEA